VLVHRPVWNTVLSKTVWNKETKKVYVQRHQAKKKKQKKQTIFGVTEKAPRETSPVNTATIEKKKKKKIFF
jgi:hypothetical protein